MAAALPQLRHHRAARADTTVLVVSLGNGWYRGRLGLTGGRAFYGDRLGVIAELEITYADGTARPSSPTSVARRRLGRHRQRPVRRSDHRRPPAIRGLVQPGAEPRVVAPVRMLEFDTSRLAPTSDRR